MATQDIPWWVALATPAAALVGVALTQLIGQANERQKRRLEYAKSARDTVDKAHASLRAFASYQPGGPYPERASAFGGQWTRIRPDIDLAAAMLAGREGHRRVVEELSRTLSNISSLSNNGLMLYDGGVWEYQQVARLMADTLGAWLRGDVPPGAARKSARRARRNLYWLDLERASQDAFERGAKHRTGIVRQWWRLVARWLHTARTPLVNLWGYLFRP